MLLDALIAFVIAALALTVVYGQGADAIVSVRASRSYQEAVSRAQARLAALDGGGLVAGDRQDDDGDGFAWHTRIVRLGALPPARDARPGALFASGTSLYDVMVDISWRGGRRVTLSTQRLGPTGG